MSNYKKFHLSQNIDKEYWNYLEQKKRFFLDKRRQRRILVDARKVRFSDWKFLTDGAFERSAFLHELAEFARHCVFDVIWDFVRPQGEDHVSRAEIPRVAIQFLDAGEGDVMLWRAEEALLTIAPLLQVGPQLERQRGCVLSDGTREPKKRVEIHDKLDQDLDGIPIAGAERKSIANEEDLEQENDFGHPSGMMHRAEFAWPDEIVRAAKNELEMENENIVG